MAVFEDQFAFHRFAHTVSTSQRYIYDNKINTFIDLVKDSCHSRKQIIEKDTIYYRAQVGSNPVDNKLLDPMLRVPFGAERMKPKRDGAREGRVNPKGIPCLYVATSVETAIAETRAAAGSQISVAEFLTNKDLTVIDFSKTFQEISELRELGEKSKLSIDERVWRSMDRAFSVHVPSVSDSGEYVSTQILSEIVKSCGYDGVKYKSLLGKGWNIAFFDPKRCDFASSALYEVTAVEYSFTLA